MPIPSSAKETEIYLYVPKEDMNTVLSDHDFISINSLTDYNSIVPYTFYTTLGWLNGKVVILT